MPSSCHSCCNKKNATTTSNSCRHSSAKTRGLSYGLWVWKSPVRATYGPGDSIRFSESLATINQRLLDDTDIQVLEDGLYRFTWSLNAVRKTNRLDSSAPLQATARVLVNGAPLDQSYAFHLELPESDVASFDMLKGKHAVNLRAGDIVSLQNTTAAASLQLVDDMGKHVVSAWIEVEKIAPST